MWPVEEAWRAPVGDFPPCWASAWGDDRFGLWAELAVGGVVQRLRWIEPTGSGGFWMGSRHGQGQVMEWPRHRVVLSDGFWMADTLCTQTFWTEVMGTNPSKFADAADGPERPVEQVSWLDSQGFLRQLGARLPSGVQLCLPTEAQWEYACRAGTETAYQWGDEPREGLANVAREVGETSVVKRYMPTAWGLYDMHGNVWEWCADGRRSYNRTDNDVQTNPKGAEQSSDLRALRGGSWADSWDDARSAARSNLYPDARSENFGFRFVIASHNRGWERRPRRPPEPA